MLGPASAAQFCLRGILIGLDRLREYSALMVVDATLRFALALLLLGLGAHSVDAYAWVLVIAIGVAHLPVLALILRPHRRPPGPQPPFAANAPSYRVFARAIAALLVGSIAAQILLNGLPILVAATANAAHRDNAGQFQAAFQLARIPLFIAVPLQTTILPSLSRLFARAGRREIAAAIARLVGVVGALALVGVAIAGTFGPTLLELIFGQQYEASRAELSLLAVGVAGYLGMLVSTQAMVAPDNTRASRPVGASPSCWPV